MNSFSRLPCSQFESLLLWWAHYLEELQLVCSQRHVSKGSDACWWSLHPHRHLPLGSMGDICSFAANMLICHLLKEKVIEKPPRKCLCCPDSRLTIVVKALWYVRCASGCSGKDRRHPVSALLALGWEQQTMKEAITIKTDKCYDRENIWRCQRNTVRSWAGLQKVGEGSGEEIASTKEAWRGGSQEVAKGKAWGG